MLATIRYDICNVLNMQHITPISKRWDYSGIPIGGTEKSKGAAHMAEGDHHVRKAPNPHPRETEPDGANILERVNNSCLYSPFPLSHLFHHLQVNIRHRPQSKKLDWQLIAQHPIVDSPGIWGQGTNIIPNIKRNIKRLTKLCEPSSFYTKTPLLTLRPNIWRHSTSKHTFICVIYHSIN